MPIPIIVWIGITASSASVSFFAGRATKDKKLKQEQERFREYRKRVNEETLRAKKEAEDAEAFLRNHKI